MKRKIAIIGGGIFGCEIAISLQSSGFEVTLFEKNSRIIMGTSRNNSRRIHMGFHYPRHLETAKQSLRGFNSFVEKYKGHLFDSFSNYYAIAKSSKTNIHQYETFLRSLSAPYKKYSREEFEIDGLRQEKLLDIYRVNEPVINLDSLVPYLESSLLSVGVNVQLSKMVTKLNQNKRKWEVYFDEDLQLFDKVVVATHGQEQFPIFSDVDQVSTVRNMEFHVTQMLVARIPRIMNIGLTIIDGDFLTLLPVDVNGTYSIYSPSASRLAVETSASNPFHESRFIKLIRSSNTKNLEKAFFDWFKSDTEIHPIESWFAIRSVPAESKDTDQRISSIDLLYPGLFKVYGTKLDHSIEIANRLKDMVIKES